MPDAPDSADLELLGLGPGATRGDLRRAYQRARATWGEGSLATYGLVEDAEREEILGRLTAAYERLARTLAAGELPGHEPLPDPGSSQGDRASGVDPLSPPAPADRPPADPGAILRRQRLSRGIDMEVLARETRIRPAILQAMEEGDAARLPAPVYIRGFVIAYAQVVGIDEPEALAVRYLEWLSTRRS